jgi:hypothetical protein
MTIRKIDGYNFDMFNIKLRNKKVHKSFTNYDTCRTITLCGIDLDFRDKDIIKDYKATNRKANCKTCLKIRYKYNDIEGLERCR